MRPFKSDRPMEFTLNLGEEGWIQIGEGDDYNCGVFVRDRFKHTAGFVLYKSEIEELIAALQKVNERMKE